MIFDIVNPENVQSADIVVGIPSLNEEDSIHFPTRIVSRGLREHYPDMSACIVNVDNHSTDDTRAAFLETETEVPKIYVTTPEGVKGKGMNIKNLFEIAVALDAKAIMMVDADLKSITPAWIENLAAPLFDGYDYVVPVYLRHKYDGTITNNIAYPMLRTLYGMRVRQPIAGDFGISGKLARCYLIEKTWADSVGQFGIDIWMTTIAIGRNFKVCQTFMGSPKIHAPKDPAGDLGPMFLQVVGTIFQLMNDFSYIWQDLKESKPSVIYGFGLGQELNIPDIEVSRNELYDSFKNGFETFSELWEEVLSDETWNDVKELKGVGMEEFYYPSNLWAKILFDFAIAYNFKTAEADVLMKALIPFYYSRTLSFVNSTLEMNMQEAEEYLEEICKVFEGEKQYLLDRWEKFTQENGRARISKMLAS